MTATINASTSAGVVVTSDTSGSLAFQSNGTTIATISSTGLQQNVGAPAFSAYQSSVQSIPNATFTKLQFQTEEFDTNNNFDNSTNYRFTPTVAGYYQINAAVYISSSTTLICTIFKNGSAYKQGGQSAGTSGQAMNVSSLVYCNGSTDYIEIYCYQGLGSSQNTDASINHTYFNGAMVRSA